MSVFYLGDRCGEVAKNQEWWNIIQQMNAGILRISYPIQASRPGGREKYILLY
jgi:hypothetical protein